MGIESGVIFDDEISFFLWKSEVDVVIYGWFNNNSFSGLWVV